MKIDINCDMGESFGNYTFGNDTAIMPYVSSCNLACGFHAGDPLVILRTLKNAITHKLVIGAHPSYPDLQGFGRRSMNIGLEELSAAITYQICAMKGMAESLGSKVTHVKPHGALYNDIASNMNLSHMFVDTVSQIDPSLRIICLAGSVTEKVCDERNISFAGEFFADRNYESNGSLVSRSKENATLTDAGPIAIRVKDFILNGHVMSTDNQKVLINAKTICIHGDNPNAVVIAKEVRKVLKNFGIEVACI